MTTRKERAYKQKIFLLESIPKSKYVRDYVVCGHSKNVYTISIKDIPKCTCPDHQTRHRRCKHIYFILCRIMKIKPGKEDTPSFSKRALTMMFKNIPPITNNLIPGATVLDKYTKLKGTTLGNDSVIVKQRMDQDTCPVCLDDIDNGEDLDYCKYSCGNPIHKECFKMWTTYHPARCVFCKANWRAPKYATATANSSKYINLM